MFLMSAIEILPKNMYEVNLLRDAQQLVKKHLTEEEAVKLVWKLEEAAFSKIPQRRETISKWKRPWGNEKITQRQAQAALTELEHALMSVRAEIIKKYPNILKKIYY